MDDLSIRALKSGISGLVALVALVFLPAGTVDYWQGWAFTAIFVAFKPEWLLTWSDTRYLPKP